MKAPRYQGRKARKKPIANLFRDNKWQQSANTINNRLLEVPQINI